MGTTTESGPRFVSRVAVAAQMGARCAFSGGNKSARQVRKDLACATRCFEGQLRTHSESTFWGLTIQRVRFIDLNLCIILADPLAAYPGCGQPLSSTKVDMQVGRCSPKIGRPL